MEKIYVITSSYVTNGLTFDKKTRYVKDYDKAVRIYKETREEMEADNEDILNDKENYAIESFNGKTLKFFYCSYKYCPEVSNFSVEFETKNLE